MPSTLVHVAFAGLIAAGLLGDDLDARAVLVVLAATAFVDLDTFVGLAVDGAHRAAFHTFLLPLFVAILLYYDTRVREKSLVVGRYGARGVRVAWTAVAAVAFAGIGLDMFFNGVNALYPLHDQFYTVNGKLLLSDQRGVVQTYVDLQAQEASDGAKKAVRTTKNTHYWTGVDPSPGKEPKNVERIFFVMRGGWQLLLVLTSAFVLSARLWPGRGRERNA